MVVDITYTVGKSPVQYRFINKVEIRCGVLLYLRTNSGLEESIPLHTIYNFKVTED